MESKRFEDNNPGGIANITPNMLINAMINTKKLFTHGMKNGGHYLPDLIFNS